MGSIVIAMPKLEDANRIGDIIRRSDIWDEPVSCSLGSEILRIVRERDVSLVISTKRLKDMGYEEVSAYIPPNVNMILMTQDASLVPYSSNIVKILMPFRHGDLINTINMLLPGASYRLKKPKPKRSAEEQKIIDDAKAVLMERNDMSEEEAFRYIQKNSMDAGRTLVESAQMVLLLNTE